MSFECLKVTFYHMWHFADPASKAAYDAQYQDLQDRNRYRDKEMKADEVNCIYFIPIFV